MLVLTWLPNLLVGEHTWGWNNGDMRNGPWSNDDFAAKRASDRQFQTAAKTWQEQRSFVLNAVAALKPGALKAAIEAEWAELKPAPFDEMGFEVVEASQVFACGSGA